MYVYMLHVRLYYDTCTPLLRHVRVSTTTRARFYIEQYICTYMFVTRMTTLRTLRPGGSRLSGTSLRANMSLVGPSNEGANHFFCPDALPCVRRCSWWVPTVRGETFFRQIWWPVRWVPAVRWRNNYFARNKEALPCCGRGPSCQSLHVQSTSEGSRSLTTLTTPRREHQGGGRWRGLGRGRRGAGEDAAVDAHA